MPAWVGSGRPGERGGGSGQTGGVHVAQGVELEGGARHQAVDGGGASGSTSSGTRPASTQRVTKGEKGAAQGSLQGLDRSSGGLHKALLRRDGVVDRSRRHAGGRDDVLHRGGVEAVLGDEVLRCGEDLAAASCEVLGGDLGRSAPRRRWPTSVCASTGSSPGGSTAAVSGRTNVWSSRWSRPATATSASGASSRPGRPRWARGSPRVRSVRWAEPLRRARPGCFSATRPGCRPRSRARCPQGPAPRRSRRRRSAQGPAAANLRG